MESKMFQERHENLRGGKGVTITRTLILKKWILWGEISPRKKAVRLDLMGNSSVGKHCHKYDSEIYFTFDRNIRFNENRYFHHVNICLKGHSHSAVNLGEEKATIYALKF